MTSMPKKDLTNQKFGLLTAISYAGNSQWNCICDCGNHVIVKTSALNSGKTKSCGCLRGKNTVGNTRASKPKEDLTNMTFGNLTPLYYIKGGKWHCKCQCGNEIDVDTRNLKSGHTKSCGCLLKKVNSENNTINMLNFENEYIKVLERKGSNKEGIALWECLCKNCGNKFITRGSYIRQNLKSCGCIHSLNEKKITEMLINNNIEFATQYTFSDLKGVQGGNLRFDFAIFENGKLHHLIEYNGKQHYEKPQGNWEENFETLLENDKRKIEYCKEHGIELRIIKYNEEYKLEDLI